MRSKDIIFFNILLTQVVKLPLFSFMQTGFISNRDFPIRRLSCLKKICSVIKQLTYLERSYKDELQAPDGLEVCYAIKNKNLE